jgi:hypothetical protein
LASQFRVRFQQWTIFADSIGGGQNGADGGYHLKDDELYVAEEVTLPTVFHQVGYAVVCVLQKIIQIMRMELFVVVVDSAIVCMMVGR